ncbi:hypothetical protein GDO81_012807 [Engystomops pustulosus]|uniref:Uncharacterized protein n=1 Tax=Engystomops pustulosus TaxID=76066 RepID=A0AAV7B1C5_ENGPU|nr:hypothetical protein GDO81_012807 [Engystomops pustulosus]
MDFRDAGGREEAHVRCIMNYKRQEAMPTHQRPGESPPHRSRH